VTAMSREIEVKLVLDIKSQQWVACLELGGSPAYDGSSDDPLKAMVNMVMQIAEERLVSDE
jgi:hypothetical protein